jgi:hypothetical protein
MAHWQRWARQAGWEAQIFAAVSEDAAEAICEALGVYYVRVPNQPLGTKWNEVVKLAMSAPCDYDYLMTMGSDDVLSPRLAAAYEPYIASGTLLFGVPDMYAWDTTSRRGLYFQGYTDPFPKIAIGAGRMLHRRAAEHVVGRVGWLYQADITRGLDTQSRNLCAHVGIAETILPPQRAVLDIKGRDNINPIGRFSSVGGWLSWEEIGKMFDIPDIESFVSGISIPSAMPAEKPHEPILS